MSGQPRLEGVQARPYRSYFTLPNNERYYDVDLGLVHLYSIDSDPKEPDGATKSSKQAKWLQQKLASSTSCFDIVYFHHAAYSSGDDHGSTKGMRWPFEQWGADAVLAGHEHVYERLQVGGIPYMTNGLGGRPEKHPFAKPLPQSVVRYNAKHGAQRVTATPTGITFELISVDDVVRDSHTVAKSCP